MSARPPGEQDGYDVVEPGEPWDVGEYFSLFVRVILGLAITGMVALLGIDLVGHLRDNDLIVAVAAGFLGVIGMLFFIARR